MWYQKVFSATIAGYRRVMTQEMRNLMKEGLERKLVPLKDYKGPVVKKLREPYASAVKELKSRISSCKNELRKLEYKKSCFEAQNLTSEARDLDSDIELKLFDIFENKSKIRDVKIAAKQGKNIPNDLLDIVP
jgi:phosphoenolpyruvate carboxylase